MKKKIIAVVLSLAMILPGNVTAFAGQVEDIVQPVAAEETPDSVQMKDEMLLKTDEQETGAEETLEQGNVGEADQESNLTESNDETQQDESLSESISEPESMTDETTGGNDSQQNIYVEQAEQTVLSDADAEKQRINVNTKYYGELSTSDEVDYYQFTINQTGHVRIDFGKEYDESSNHCWDVEIYDTNWNMVKKDTFYCGNTKTDKSSELGLNVGTYYIKVLSHDNYGYYWSSVKYNLTVNYAASSVWEKELNGSFDTANGISTNTTYYGSNSATDKMDYDYYKIQLKNAGHIQLNFGKEYDAAEYHSWNVILYNADREEMVTWTFYCGNSKMDETCEYGLAAGTYYVLIRPRYENSYYASDVTYNFKINYSASNVWEKEFNDDLNTPNAITANTVYYGTTISGDNDCYKFTLTQNGPVNIDFGKEYDSETYRGWNIILYNSEREEISKGSADCGNTTTESVITTNLTKGTYYLKICRKYDNDYYKSEATYNIKVTAKNEPTSVSVSPVTGLKISGHAADALRLNWNKSQNASGYIVEQYKGGTWSRIVKITNASTLTYRVAGLNASTSYKFRVKAYAMNGNEAVYSTYSNITGKTNPAAVAGLKIGGTAKDALRLNWNKNSGASGYIIEQYKGGKWTRIKKITENDTVTYRVEKLSAGITYKFRVQAYGFDGNTALYSSYQYISGTTTSGQTASAGEITGLKIGGRAQDALRLNWNKSTKASGYIVEQYKNGTWTRIARNSSNSTTTYRVEKLSAGTTYKFRVKAFAFNGNTPVYSVYKTISGTTNPASVSGFRISGAAKDALRLNWNRNTKCSGYIIEMYKNNSWVRVVKISGNSTTTYRVENLRSNSSYIFRICSFTFDGNTPLYSSYQLTSGTTK